MNIGGHNIEVEIRPWRVWPGSETAEPRSAPFKASWSKTLALLGRELNEIDAENIIVELNVPESSLRRDGWIKENARCYTEGVILSFTSPNTGGAVRFPCDAFDDWQDNIRAIALGLEALRKVERYGITQRHEQFAGYRQITATSGTTMNAKGAAAIIEDNTFGFPSETILRDAAFAKKAIRAAVNVTHPDKNNGDRSTYDDVETAKRVLTAHHGVAL